MIQTNKAVYAATLKDFLVDVKKNKFIEAMKEGSRKLGIPENDSQIRAWNDYGSKNSLRPLFEKMPEDVVVAFEYQVPIGGGRIDCILFGHGNDGHANIIHIELKQWSNENVTPYYDHHTYKADVIVNGYRSGNEYTSHPCEQVSGYDNVLRNHVKALEENGLNLYGFAYCYNYKSEDKDCALLDSFYKDLMNEYPLFCKDESDLFANKLNELLCKGKGEDIFNAFVNSEIGTTKRLCDVAAQMLEGAEDVFNLVGDQINTYKDILGAVKDTKPNEKTAIIVKGGPGTGKSVIAMKLLSELYKEEYNCQNVYYATRSRSLRNQWKEILKGVARRFGKNGEASSLIKSTFDFKPFEFGNKENGGDVLIVDEAHRIQYKSNDQTDSSRPSEHRSYLPQILSMLYTSRVCVFFIDDKQSIKSKEIGLSSNIEMAAGRYKEFIEETNKIYLGEKKCPRNHPIIKLTNSDTLPSLKRKIERLQVGDKGYETIRNKINCPIIEPMVEKVNVHVFELKDQFRCNGSNNYLNWIDQVLYDSKTPQKVKLNRESYDFGIYDNPNDLYAKVRSLDSYAVVADRFKEQMGDLFTYEALYTHTHSPNMKFEQSARLVAGWCWDWDAKTQLNRDTGDLEKEVDLSEFGFDFSLPWETKVSFMRNDFRFKYAVHADSWCNQNEGVNQVGCIHSIQGWETDYVGVIIGPDLMWDDVRGCLCYNPKGSNHDLTHKACKENDQLILNTYRVLLTRGKKGCFIFACDPKVRDYFKRCLNQ